MSTLPYCCREAFTALATVQFDAVVEFYRQVFGIDPHPYVDQVYAEFRLPGMKLGIFKPKDAHAEEFSQSAQAGLSLCLEVDDLEGAIAHLTHLGYPPPGDITIASHGREVYGYDPAGNRIIFHEAA